MRKDRVSIARIMKYVVALAVIGFIVLLMLYASGSRKPFEEVEKAVSASLDKESLTEQDDSRLRRNFGLNPADYAGVMYYSSESNISAEEVLLIKVNREDQIETVTEAIEERIESRMNDFEGYAPGEVRILEDSVQSVRGAYIFFAAAPEAGDYLSVFNSSL
ncbi:MAG TPA: DUF4358 domain-containing protein [Candidatus Mediterraneibacter pullistercoris]|nr:DUF4358 domain-containing protein [Candidatus Mediterraneibacter pullistercoris]